MKKSILLAAVAWLVAVPATAQFQQMVEVLVKPGRELAFEGYIKKVAEGADKIGSPVAWNTFNVAIGKANPTYRISLQFEKWAERDNWDAGPRQILTKAFGEEEGNKVFQQGASAIAHSSTRVWEVIDDVSASLPTDEGPAKLYEVTIRWVDPTQLSEYEGLLRRFKTAYDAADGDPAVVRWVLRFGSGQNTVFRRTQPFNSWAERDAWNAGEVLGKHYGPDWPLLRERLQSIVIKNEHFVSVHRPDLSRSAGASTSND